MLRLVPEPTWTMRQRMNAEHTLTHILELQVGRGKRSGHPPPFPFCRNTLECLTQGEGAGYM